jgi:hypothetical protein
MLPLKTLLRFSNTLLPTEILQMAISHHMAGPAVLASIKYNDVDASSQASSSSAVSALEAEEKTLRERLIVLEEQKFSSAR